MAKGRKKNRRKSVTKPSEAENRALAGPVIKNTSAQTNEVSGVASALSDLVSLKDIIKQIEKGIEIVSELDQSFTKMRKTSDETTASLKAYGIEAFNIARQTGTTASAIQNNTADWMKLGESLKEAKKSAEDTAVLLNISDFENVNEATNALASMSKAYRDLEKSDMVDVLNNLGNNYNISTKGLAETLKDSAVSLESAHNDFYEAAALAATANEAIQEPGKAGAGLNAVSLRITGTEEARRELARLGGNVEDYVVAPVSKMNQTIQELTKTQGSMGVSILDMNGNYRSTFEILSDIAGVWDKIAKEDISTGQKRQDDILKLMAGNDQSNFLDSILQNPDLLKRTYVDAVDSSGSAQEELELYMDSVKGAQDQLMNSWQELWATTLDPEVIKFWLNVANAIVQTANAMGGLLPVAVSLGTAFAVLKNADKQIRFRGNERIPLIKAA